VCAPGYDLDTSTGWCKFTPDPTFGKQCLIGMSINPDLWCCTVEGASPAEYFVCPPGSTYDSCSQACVYEEVLGPGKTECVDGSVYFDTCRPPDKPGCENPGQYGSQAACEGAGCNWVCVGAAAPVCGCE